MPLGRGKEYEEGLTAVVNRPVHGVGINVIQAGILQGQFEASEDKRNHHEKERTTRVK